MAVPKRILLVDDDVDFVDGLRIALGKAGFEALSASGTKEAMKVLGSEDIALVILDVMMSTPDEGFRLARSLRADGRTRRIPIIMLTAVNEANAQKGLVFRYSERDRDETWLPVDRFIDKPARAGDIISAVVTLIGTP